jgi:NIPSNAP
MNNMLKKLFFSVLVLGTFSGVATAQKTKAPGLFLVKIYYLKDSSQYDRTNNYLKEAYVPALHQANISKVGVFYPVGNDTAAIKKLYVLIPFSSFEEFISLDSKLQKNSAYINSGKDYLDAAYNNAPYQRIESILLQSFADVKPPTWKNDPNERIYELRSYEGPTEKLFENKVDMFVKGGEIPLFERLGFNAVFYGKALVSAHMPHLMYMTSFENMSSRDAHWKSFGNDPEWKALSASPQYQNNVSHIDITLLHPTGYSDL